MTREPTFRPHRWIIHVISAFVPKRLRAEWRREWDAELTYQEEQSTQWREGRRTRWRLIGQSLGSSWDALSLQRRRLEDDFVQDGRHGLRLAMRSPGLALAACASIAVGIGGTTAAFSLIDAAVLRQWPYPHADRLVVVRTDLSRHLSTQAFQHLAERDTGLDHLTAAEAHAFVLDIAGQAVLVNGHRVTDQALALLGLNGPLRPALGRPFLESEFATTGEPVLLITHRLWQTHFGSSVDIVGRSIKVDGGPAQIIGVLPRQFDFFPNADILTPLSFSGRASQNPYVRTLEVFGSLKPGLEAGEAAWRLTWITSRLRPVQNAFVESVRERLFKGLGPTIRVLSLVSLVILAVCCVNFATLLTVRSADRRQELAVRTALGAGRERIVRQLVTEAMVLSIAGGIAGLLVAHVGRSAFSGSVGAGALNSASFLDWRLLTFAAVLTIASGFLCSIGPARRITANIDLDVALKDGLVAPETTLTPRWFASNWLASSIQLALTMVLLVGAGLLVKSLAKMQAFDPGYDSSNAVSVRFDLPPARYRTDADVARFVGDMTERLRALPGVEAVGAASSLPYAAGGLRMQYVMFEQPVRISGPPEPMPLGWVLPPPPPPASGDPVSTLDFHPALTCAVDPTFFRAMRIPLVMGRDFTPFDSETSTPVVIINQAMAERYWAGVDPIGRRIRLGPLTPWRTIVGVVGNVRRFARDDAIRSEYYEPFAQAGDQRRLFKRLSGRSVPIQTPSPLMLVVRSPVSARAISSGATSVTRAIDPALPIVRVSTLRDDLDDGIADRRFLFEHVVAFAGIALLLAAAGVYTVTSQVVRGRARELSIRAALGAKASHLVWLAMRDALVVIGIGGSAGLLISALFTPQLAAFLYDVSPWDVGTFLAVVLILIPVVVSAAYVPARRAGRIDPLVALKSP